MSAPDRCHGWQVSCSPQQVWCDSGSPKRKREKSNTTGSGPKAHKKCGQEISQPRALVLKALVGDHLLVASTWPFSSTVSSPHLHPAFPADQVGLLRRKGSSQVTCAWDVAHPTSLNAVEAIKEVSGQRLPFPTLRRSGLTARWNTVSYICRITYKNQSQYICGFKLIRPSLSTLSHYKKEEKKSERRRGSWDEGSIWRTLGMYERKEPWSP